MHNWGGPRAETEKGACKSGKRKDPELGTGILTSDTVSLTCSTRKLLSQPWQMGQVVLWLGRVSVGPPGDTMWSPLREGSSRIFLEFRTFPRVQLLGEKAEGASL